METKLQNTGQEKPIQRGLRLNSTALHFEIGKSGEEKLQSERLIQELAESNRELNKVLNTLKDSELLFREFFESAPEAIGIVDMDTQKFVDFNTNLLKMFKYSADEMLQKGPVDISPVLQPDGEDSASGTIKMIGQLMEGKKPIFEWTHIDSKGNQFPCEVRLTKLSVPGRNLIRGSMIDISEKKNAEEKLKNSEQYNRALIENITDAIVLINENAETVFQSPSAERLSGFTLQDTKNKSVFEFIHPDDLPSCMEFFERVVASPGVPQHNQYRLLHKEGHYIWIEGTIINLLHNESVKAFIVNYRDITQRVEAEKQIEFESNNLNALINNTNDLMWSVDRDFNLITSNVPFDEMAKINFGRVVEKGTNILFTAFTPEMMNHYKHRYERAFAGEAYTETEHFTVPFEFWVEVSYYPIRNGDEIIGTACHSRDITAAKIAEAEIAELNESLEQKVNERTAELETANKELESFSYSVSHDLRAPLRVIDGYGKMLLKSQIGKLDKQGQEDLKVIMSNATHMGSLIDDLLDFSRLGRASVIKKRVNMTELVFAVIEEEKADTNTIAEIRVQDLESTQCDPVLMTQVWTNLISNAVKYSRKREKPLIEIGSTSLHGKLTYYIRDNGAGFDMQHSDKLFVVFQRLHKVTEYEGTGVGLALAERIIKKHGGKIWADAQVNEGATFYFTLSN